MNDAKTYLLLLGQEDIVKDFKHKPDTGTLFINKFRSKESHPNYTGQYAMPDGTIREIAAWDNGNYLSIRFSDQYVTTKKTA